MNITDDFVYDPYSRQAMNDPLPIYEVLRDSHPVYYADKYDAFVISRFEDSWAALGDSAFAAHEGTGVIPREVLLAHNDGPVAPPSREFFMGFQQDSPWYELARQAHGGPLRPGSVRKLEPFIREQTRLRLDQLLPRGEFDLTQDYGGIVSATTMCHLLRIPLEHAKQLLDTINRATLTVPRDGEDEGSGPEGDPEEVVNGLIQLLLPGVVEYRATRDGSWPMGEGLYDLEVDGRRLSDAEVAANLMVVMVGGTETLPKVIGHGIMELARHPEQLAEVRSNLAMNSSAAVEEMVRYCGPAQWFMRTATKDTEIAGVTVRPGQRVIWLTASANRDPREFDNPDEFIWNRPIPRTLAFGLGQRFCMGIHLARLEGRILVEEFLSRVADFEFDLDRAVRHPSSFQWGYNTMPVKISRLAA